MKADNLAKLAYKSPELRHELRDIVRQVMGASSYKDLADAAEVTGDSRYIGRNAEIWYANADISREMSGGYRAISKRMPWLIPDNLHDLADNHTLLGTLGASNAEDAWVMMQGHNWSPAGEARGLIQKRGLKHTSMSVGDVVVLRGVMFMVDMSGFARLG